MKANLIYASPQGGGRRKRSYSEASNDETRRLMLRMQESRQKFSSGLRASNPFREWSMPEYQIEHEADKSDIEKSMNKISVTHKHSVNLTVALGEEKITDFAYMTAMLNEESPANLVHKTGRINSQLSFKSEDRNCEKTPIGLTEA